MPFYEYQCTACSHRLEALQKISDAPLLYCPECGEAGLKKLISRAAFQLKGTGWYETDFKNSGKESNERKKDDGKESKNAGTKSTGTESKPARETADSTDKKDRSSKKSSSTEPMKKSA